MRCLISLLVAFVWVLPVAAQGTPVQVVGEQLDGALRSDLISVLPEQPQPETKFEARRLARQAASQLEDYLNSRAYFAAEIEPRIEEAPQLASTVDIRPGPQFKINHIDISFDGMAPDDQTVRAVDKALTLVSEDTAFPSAIVAQEQRLIDALKARGFAFAKAAPREVIGDREAASLDVNYILETGPRVRFGEVQYGVESRTRRGFLDVLLPFDEGDVYAADALAELNRRLGEARIYAIFSARLADTPSGLSPEGDAIHDVIVTLVERDRYTVAAGASYSSTEGVGVTMEWTRRNHTRRGDTLRVLTTVAEQQRALEVDWNIPNVLGYGRGVSFNSKLAHDETDAFDRTSAVLGAALNIKRNPELTYVFGVASEFTREEDAVERRDLQIVSASGALRFDHANDLLDPTKGWRASVRLEPGLVTGDEGAGFVSAVGQASYYHPFDPEHRFVIAARLRSGLVFGADTLELPTSRRFFAGGGGSARGYAYQSIGPRDVDDTPIGGRGLLEMSGELRWRQGDRLGYAAFVDAASVKSREVPGVSDLRLGAGIGVRYYTAIGPIRLDLATPINPQDGDDPIQIYISIGQAF